MVSLLEKLSEIVSNFKKNIDSVYSLMDFDKVILDYSIKAISELADKLKNLHKIDNPHLTAANTLQALMQISSNNSLRNQYNQIFNQCIVLLVSYFGSAIGDIFKYCLTEKLKEGISDHIRKEEIKISLGELRDSDFNLSETIGELIASKKDISFQDMQSISKAFKEYFDLDIKRDKIVNNIIIGQACRHVIVHCGNIADSRLLRQIEKSIPRDIKQNIELREIIQFEPAEIKIVGDSMKEYIIKIVDALG